SRSEKSIPKRYHDTTKGVILSCGRQGYLQRMAISDTIKRGAMRAPHRSLLRATGAIQSESDWDKPFIAVANSFVQIVPGHAHLDVVGRKVRAAIREAG